LENKFIEYISIKNSIFLTKLIEQYFFDKTDTTISDAYSKKTPYIPHQKQMLMYCHYKK